MQTVNITGQERPLTGKSASGVYRRQGLVPCVLYSKEENIQFNTAMVDLKPLVYSPDFKLADISINGKVHRCILKDLQFHPVSDSLIHVDFLKLVQGTKVKIEVPLRLAGNAAGVKSGGKLIQRVRSIKIKVDPDNMVSELTLDVSALDLGQSMRIRDISIPKNVEIVNNGAIPVVSIEIPRALKSAAAEAAAPKAGGKAPAKK
ncbi:MAG: 50S ribosomal protein L25 [Saprospiraceae bacterium]|jgi:large subunit ribosomal protein L25|nr:50S ribosomal protein L25 [Saprospiraceae bacterium]MBK7796622.1 50S ribosomal protein L25 [Saprospiraceae bacterium]MBK8152666.1 50S ribosomal protein L25 [Saprospiraceae bacterium]MBL0259988.1 50S ribosomal protein L25 [Saprospiraceae bacterium]MBX7163022.1 50S ribosomal protein L25 [Saprospiraceae bacterium]